MTNTKIEEFAKLLIREVRDKAIANCDMLLEPGGMSPIAKRWHQLLTGPPIELGKEMIPDCVDSALFYLLHAIDTSAIRLSFTASDGTTVDLGEAGMGELAGWYAGIDPWIKNYSQQRFVDNFTDL